MKKITCLALSFVWASALFSQSAKEIVSRQMEYVNAHMEQGLSFTLTDAMSYVDRYSESYFQEKKNGVIVSSDHNVTVDEKEADFQSTKVFVQDGKVLIESPQEAGLTVERSSFYENWNKNSCSFLGKEETNQKRCIITEY